MKRCIFVLALSFIINLCGCASAQGYAASEFDGSIMLGRPTNETMTVCITANTEQLVFVEWGDSQNTLTSKSGETLSASTNPAVIVLDQLSANHLYYYRVNYKAKTASAYLQTQVYSFQMPRSTGSSYSFLVQSDSHLLNKADPALYQSNMDVMASLKPDFFISLGDDFLNDQVKTDPAYQNGEKISNTYIQQLPYLSTVAKSAPFFFTMGNHEGEYGSFFDGTDKNLTVMATNIRKTYYKNPEPNSFYSGNTQSEAFCGNPENYYAYTWGDALYVSIDPYRYTTADPYNISDGWDWTLGKTQYDWLRKTLETSTAKYKFVFSHHAIGNIRGGAEIARLFEWGGYDQKGNYQFDQMRPGWGKPVQQIFKDAGVTVFFQGHDHLFAREVVDGVIYQTLPKPAETAADIQSNGDAYPNADELVNSGFLKIEVTPENVKVDYYRTYCMLNGAIQSTATGIVYSYTVDSSHKMTVLTGGSDDFSNYGNENASDSTGNGKKQDQGKEKSLSVTLDGKTIGFDVQPFIDENGRTQVPLRFIAEQMGATVTWQPDGQQNTIQIDKGGTTILSKIGDKIMTINGQAKTLGTSPFIKDGRTFVPVRFISEALGATVSWDGNTRTVTIATGAAVNSGTLSSVPTGGFSFAVEADPHFDENTSTTLLNQTMANIVSARPDFLIDLGDMSMAEKLCKTQVEVNARYSLAADYFSLLGTIPLYLVNGNHDGEYGANINKNQMLEWARAARLHTFPYTQSSTAAFSGNVTTANYYTFVKGDVQLIILDPYTYSMDTVGHGGGWATTLGKTQYDWLVSVLKNSTAKFRFVFVHNLVGGESKDSRGGAEAAAFFEWGGYNESGVYEFSQMRQGWAMPIHDLLVKYGVDVVFHGHDHFYAKQEKDGIVYQLVPQPGTPGNSINNAGSYGYESGIFLPSAGYLRVVVSNEKVVVEYVNTAMDGAATVAAQYDLN